MKKETLLFFVLILFFACQNDSMEAPPIDNSHPSEYFEVDYGSHPLQRFTLQTPDDSDANTKVAILIHGGGWVMGYHPDDSVTTFTGRYNWDLQTPLLDKGIAVLTMKYRTACYNTQAEEFQNNTTYYINRMVEDINLVIANVQANATEYKVSSEHFQLVGESGGGHIVQYYGFSLDAAPEVKSVVSMFGPTNLDAEDFKQIINDVPLLLATPPNYFLRKAEDCSSVTNQQVRTLSSLKSFSDHHTISIFQPNSFLDTLSTTFAANLQNNIPTFITHGVEDELVPFTQAEAIQQAVQEQFGTPLCAEDDFSCSFKLGRYENCGHGWTGANCSRATIMSDIVNWLEQH